MRMIVRIIGQGALIALVLIVAAVAWAMMLPSSHALLDRAGVLQPMVRLGVPLARGAQIDGPVAGGGTARGAVPVLTAPVGAGERSDRVAAIGTGQALHSVMLVPEVSGRVSEIFVSAGQLVSAGTVVASLDRAAEQIARDRAELMLDEARATAERLGRLQATGTATDVRSEERRGGTEC